MSLPYPAFSISEAEHNPTVNPDFNVGGTFTAICSCGWMSGDEGTAALADEAVQMHIRREYHPWQIAPGKILEWEPRQRP